MEMLPDDTTAGKDETARFALKARNGRTRRYDSIAFSRCLARAASGL